MDIPFLLRLDPKRAVEEISAGLRAAVEGLGRRGGVLGLSGGIDSAVVAALCGRGLGGARVLALLMPEEDSEPESLELGRAAAEACGIEWLVEDIAPILRAAGCYERRDRAIRGVVPDYGPGWRAKIVLPPLLGSDRLRLWELVVQPPGGEPERVRLKAASYLEIVAATNLKQRTRKLLEYTHADRLGYAVIGTPNRLEYDQGFFVKGGDGAADVKPIAHLYKSQVYQLAEELGVPEAIRMRPPTTDTYSLPQGQDEFYFSVGYEMLDLCLYARDHGMPAGDVAGPAGLSVEDVERVFRDIDRKRVATAYLHAPPVLLDSTGASSA